MELADYQHIPDDLENFGSTLCANPWAVSLGPLNLSISNHAARQQIINAIMVDKTAIAIRLPFTFLLGLLISTPRGFIALAFLLLPNAPSPTPSGAEGGEGGIPAQNSYFLVRTSGAEFQHVQQMRCAWFVWYRITHYTSMRAIIDLTVKRTPNIKWAGH